MHAQSWARCATVAIPVVVLSCGAHANHYTLVDLGVYAAGAVINDAGEVAGTSGGRAVSWNGKRWRTLSQLPSHGTGINAAGEVVGEIPGDMETAPALWRPHKPVFVIPLPGGVDERAVATGINRAGVVVGIYYETGYDGRCFQWSKQGGAVDLGFPKTGLGCYPLAINDKGQVTGSAATKDYGYTQAFRYDHGVFQVLGSLGHGANTDVFSRGLAINSAGDIAGVSRAEPVHLQRYHAILWRGTKMIDLDADGRYRHTEAAGINDAGDIVGFKSERNGADAGGVRFTNPGIVELDAEVTHLGGWHVLSATGVNGRGDIVAAAVDPEGHERTVLLRLDDRD